MIRVKPYDVEDAPKNEAVHPSVFVGSELELPSRLISELLVEVYESVWLRGFLPGYLMSAKGTGRPAELTESYTGQVPQPLKEGAGISVLSMSETEVFVSMKV